MRTTPVCLLACLWAAWASAGELPRVEQERLWNTYVLNKPNPRILDDMPHGRAKWEVIEGIVVVRQVEGLTPLATALATVAMNTCGVRVTGCALTESVVRRFGEQWKGAELTETEKAKLNALCEDKGKEFWSRHPELKKGVPFDVTFGVRDAKLLQQTIRRADSVTEALREVARLHGYVPVLESGRNLPFGVYKEAIDKRVPILMEVSSDDAKPQLPLAHSKSSYRVCFGYLIAEGKEYLVLADCRSIPFEKRPPHISRKDLESDHPWTKQMVEEAKQHLITSDYETGCGKPLAEGTEIKLFRPDCCLEAHLIYGWAVSAQGLARDLHKIPKCESHTPLEGWLTGGD